MVRWKLGYIAAFGTYWVAMTARLLMGTAFAEETPTKPIRVALYADKGATIKSLPEVEKCLKKADGFAVARVLAKEIRSGALDGYDVIICPGGSGSGEGETLGDDGRNRVRAFVKRGGGYIGICAGAYLASIEYPWSIGLLNAHVLDRPHWDRGEGNVDLKVSSAGKTSLSTDIESCTFHYENGPLLGPGEKDDLPAYELLASYDTEITQNAPPGTMKGTAAIARGKYGEGRVVCFSPHPEKTPGREAFLQSAVRWAARQGDHN
jgi:glutamine amidotransferase-like uncharacterized protein